MPHRGRVTERAIKISGRLEHRFPIDLLVRSPGEVRRRLKWNDFFLREATEKGVVMYESAGAKQALRDCKVVRRQARLSLNLPV